MPVAAPDPIVPAYSAPSYPAATATALRVTGTTTPALDGVLLPAGAKNGKTHWTDDGNAISGDVPSDTAGTCLYWSPSGPGEWILIGWASGNETGRWTSPDTTADPSTITSWEAGTGCHGEPTLTLAGQAAAVLPRHNPPEHIGPPVAVIPEPS